MNKNIKDNIKVDSDLEFYKEKIPSFQLNLIKEYFDVDEENKIINLISMLIKYQKYQIFLMEKSLQLIQIFLKKYYL